MKLKPKSQKPDDSRDDKQAALKLLTEEPTKRVNFNVPESQHNQLKAAAALKGLSLKELVLKALDEYLSHDS